MAGEKERAGKEGEMLETEVGGDYLRRVCIKVLIVGRRLLPDTLPEIIRCAEVVGTGDEYWVD